MTRFDDRLRARLRNEEFASGYREMEAQLQLLKAIDAMRNLLGVSKEEMAKRMGRHRAALSRTLNAHDANPTMDTIVEMLDAIGVSADIELHQRVEANEVALRVAVRPLHDQVWHCREPARNQSLPWMRRRHTKHTSSRQSRSAGEVPHDA